MRPESIRMAIHTNTALSRAFGITVARLRKRKGWSQEVLGYESGLTRTYISLLERGAASPTLNTVDMLARNLDLDAAQLIQLALFELNRSRASSAI